MYMKLLRKRLGIIKDKIFVRTRKSHISVCVCMCVYFFSKTLPNEVS